MLKIDDDKKLIEMTRGDTANIVFSAKKDDGTTYNATTNDELVFAVGKKYGDELWHIKNEYNVTPSTFWTITIPPSQTSDMKFGDYWFDVQLTHHDSGVEEVDTIIGKTDEISPTFRLWGEIAK